jgi:hypothetical protein
LSDKWLFEANNDEPVKYLAHINALIGYMSGVLGKNPDSPGLIAIEAFKGHAISLGYFQDMDTEIHCFSNNPDNITMTMSGNAKINWFLWDDVGPGKYRVWTNDSNNNYYVWINWMNWTNNTNLQVPINRTILGIFNYTIEYNNSVGIFGNPDTVIVNIVPISPVIGLPDALLLMISLKQSEELHKQIFGLLIIGIIGLILGLIFYNHFKRKHTSREN